jgi:hypothetical protein
MADWKFAKSKGLLLFIQLMFFSYAGAQEFTNIAPSLGIDAVLPTSNLFGAGVSFADFDNDGWDDLTIGMTGEPIKIYRNNQGVLEEQNIGLPNLGSVKSMHWVDVDNDYDLDFYVSVRDNPMKIYRNNGDGTFTDMTNGSGLHQNTEDTYGASWGDYDLDGDLDLYVCNYQFSTTMGSAEQRNHLYRNDGNFQFTDVTDAAGVSGGVELSFQSLWFDYNYDLLPDLYVINDKTNPNRIYRNNGDGTFTDLTGGDTGLDVVIDAMTASYDDYNNDLLPDMYITNTQVGGNVLLRASQLGFYQDVATQTNTILFDYTWGATWFDKDNDMDLDLFICESEALAFNSPNYLLENLGASANYSFEDVSEDLTTPDNSDAYSVASGDIDNDGNIDLLVQNRYPYNAVFWHNEGTGNNYIKVALQGSVSNTYGIGSWIEVFTAEQDFIRHTHLGEQYLAQNSFKEHFGLGSQTVVDSIRITWPNGWVDTFYDLPVNETFTFTEGDGYSPAVQASSLHVCDGDSVLLVATEGLNPVWQPSGVASDSIYVSQAGTYTYSATNELGIPFTSAEIVLTSVDAPVLNATVTMPACYGFDDATIELSSDQDDVTFFVAGEPADANLSALTAGNYLVVMQNSSGCESFEVITIEQPDSIEIELTIDPILCAGELATAEATSTGGTGAVSFDWSASPEGLTAGAYSVTATDENGCESSLDFEVTTPEPLVVSSTESPADEGNNGSIDLLIEGGTPDYFVQWTGPDGFSSSDEDLSGLESGVYIAVVTDVNGCFTVYSVVLNGVGVDRFEPVNEFTLFPQPSSTHIVVHGAVERLHLAELYDLQGRRVHTWELTRSEVGQISLPLPQLADGRYQLVLSSEVELQSLPVLIMH